MAEPIDVERVQEIARIVLAVIADTQSARRPRSWPARAADWISSHWPLVAMLVSGIVALLGWRIYRISLLQPLEELAAKQNQYHETEATRLFKKEMARQHAKLGRSLLGNMAFEAARAELKEARTLDETSVPASTFVDLDLFESVDGNSYDPMIAQKRLEALREANPNDPIPLVFLGHVANQLQKPDEAIQLYSEATALDPALAEPFAATADILDDRGDRIEALRYYVEALERSPWNQRYLNNASSIALLVGEYEIAEWVAQDALNLDGRLLGSYDNWAQAAMMQGKFAIAADKSERLDTLLRDDAIYELKNNQASWIYFLESSGKTVSLSHRNAKRCYATYERALVLSALRAPGAARQFIGVASALCDSEAADDEREAHVVRLIVENNARMLARHQPSIATDVDNFLSTAFSKRLSANRASSTKLHARRRDSR